MRYSRHLEVAQFLREVKDLKILPFPPREEVLERLERQRILIPRIRLRYPGFGENGKPVCYQIDRVVGSAIGFVARLADAPGDADKIADCGFADPVAQLAEQGDAVPLWVGLVKRLRTLKERSGKEYDFKNSRSKSRAPDRYPKGQDYRLGARSA